MFNKKILALVICFLICFSNLAFAMTWSSSTSLSQNEAIATSGKLGTTPNPLFNLKSKSACLMDSSTGQVLYEYNSHEKLRPASVTKVMSLLLIMEALDSGKIKLTDRVQCSDNARGMGGSQIWLDPREQLTVHEMLKAITIVSANDCTVAMAEFVAGSEESFVKMMNDRAKELGMNDTTFINPHGIDADGHLTSANDIAIMSRELIIKHPKISNYSTIYIDSLRDGKSQLVNTNKLVRFYKNATVTGLKTGSTSIAKFSLSATAQRDNLKLVAVIMTAPDSKTRFAEASKLLDYGFANFATKRMERKNTVMGTIPVVKGVKDKIDVIIAKDVDLLVARGQDKNITKDIKINPQVTAPVVKGQRVGHIIYKINGKEVGRVDLLASCDVAKMTFTTLFDSLFDKWIRIGK